MFDRTGVFAITMWSLGAIAGITIHDIVDKLNRDTGWQLQAGPLEGVGCYTRVENGVAYAWCAGADALVRPHPACP